MSPIQDKICTQKIISVLVIERLLVGGVSIVELALRSNYGMTALKRCLEEFLEILLRVGTVLFLQQVRNLKKPGSPFAVSPGLNKTILEEAQRDGLDFFSGIATPSDIEDALEYDIRLLKFFPSEPLEKSWAV